jgi:ATP-dependent DNA helicase RecQ
MPAAHWDIYRLGARIPSIDSLLDPAAGEQVGKLQQALSSVASIDSTSQFYAPMPATEDGLFIGRLLLGLLSRGWPTFASPDVEQALLESMPAEAGLRFIESGPSGQIGWKVVPNESTTDWPWGDTIRGALFRGDPRLQIDEAVVASLTDSNAEQTFYRENLAPLLGNAIGWLELQRPLASMVRQDAPSREQFGSERVDFSLDLPGAGRPVRLVIELDGPHHDVMPQIEIDENRDTLLGKHGWETRRVPVRSVDDGSLNRLPLFIQAIIQGNRFPFTHIEDDDQALADLRNREAARLILTPHAVARVQLALSRAMMSGILDLLSEEWVLAVVEREVPCAELAARDLLNTLHHLCQLYEIEYNVNSVRVLIVEDHRAKFPRPIWVGSTASSAQVIVEPLRVEDDFVRIDLAIDVAVGCHPTRRYATDPLRNLMARHRVTLRTAQRQSGYLVESWPEPRQVTDPLAHQPSLEYFLQTLFRKREFRPGQMPIIERVLRRDDVIGLLPTGAGKSITFQLPALLSPGLTLVIDPIKSLMQDQVENLEAAGVKDAIQINSDTLTDERSRREWQFSQGEYRMVFISPERLQIQEFRDILMASAGKRSIAYVVIDEAHCVSEWGHDFRTAYLNLGRIARDFCGRGGNRPPMVALTGTASQSVLRDIQRELKVESSEAIVRPAKFEREELKFEVVPVQKNEKLLELVRLIGHDIPEMLGVDADILSSGACGGIVFCPHVNGKLGVLEVAENLGKSLPQFAAGKQTDPYLDQRLVGFYSGESPTRLGMSSAVYAGYKTRVQRAFKVGEIPLLVATSAFGMGIDKPNIRYTIHFAMAKSIEAFAQEAGRAGRDEKTAICAVLFTDHYGESSGDALDSANDCLAIDISSEEAQIRASASGWDSDDAETQMYLHTRSYQGIVRESAAVRALYHRWIEPLLPPSMEREGQSVDLVIAEAAYRAEIEDQMIPLLPAEAEQESEKSEAATETDVNTPRPDLQRLIFRLALLGVISDYTVTYSHGNIVYSLAVQAIGDDLVERNLYDYVARYRTSERINAVRDHLISLNLDDRVCCCIDTLCWFVYEEIEKRRRQGMVNMRAILRESLDGGNLAGRINQILSHTALTQTVFDVLDADDHRQWSRIGDEIGASDSAEHVYYQCRRALEDAPGHPGLLLLLGLSLQAMDADRGQEVATLLGAGLREGRKGFALSDQQDITSWMVRELVRISPAASTNILGRVVLLDRNSVLPGAILRGMADGTITADPILERTCQRRILHTIDDRLRDFMTA